MAPETPGRYTKAAKFGIRAVTRLRSRVRQPGSDRLLRYRRWGSRDWADGHKLALEVKSLNPARDGAVLPILHLNGYKIAGPTVLARIPKQELSSLFAGCGYQAYFVEGDDPAEVHQSLAAAMETVIEEIRSIQTEARQHGFTKRRRWPLIVMRTPKGWTGPKLVDGVQVEGTFRSHQVPLEDFCLGKPAHQTATGRLDEELSPRRAVRRLGAAVSPGAHRPAAQGRTSSHERERPRQWRIAVAGSCACRIFATTRSRLRSLAQCEAEARRECSDTCCVTS